VADVIIHFNEKDIDIKEETALTFVFAAIKHRCINVMRDAANRAVALRDHAEQVQDGLGFYYSEGHRPDQELDMEESVTARMDALSPLVRRTLVRHYADGVSVEDIAGEEGVDVEAVRKRLTRGRNMLKGE
jgi:DNA-directed RNA polymerase specialized sigma24 family protein